jgi:hypothetical protein
MHMAKKKKPIEKGCMDPSSGTVWEGQDVVGTGKRPGLARLGRGRKGMKRRDLEEFGALRPLFCGVLWCGSRSLHICPNP